MSVGRLQRYGLPFANVVATGVATAQITPGRTIECIKLALGGTALTKAMLTDIKLKANGKTFFQGTGTQLDKINAYRGRTQEAAYLDLGFSDYSGDTELDRAVGAFDTSGIVNITAEVTIAGATAPTLKSIIQETALQRDKTGAPLPFAGMMTKVLTYPWNISTGGKLPFTLPFGAQNGAIIKRVHVEHTGNMTAAEVKQDSLTVHESLKAENENEQKRWSRTPQTNWYTLDFVLDGNMRKALDTRDARSLEWLFTFSAADSGTILVEYLDPLGNL